METKETKKVSSPCEQYVVAKLERTEKELEELKQENEMLKSVVDELNTLIRLGTKDFEIQECLGEFTGKERIKIYWKDNYLGLEDVETLHENPSLYDLVNLIRKGQARLERK